ncbi:TrmH family RNA methyltransferase [Leptolinea tardivitalis]|uniref:TrmH family RNA methyltransferase n=1 Tax=Leptolinea tardivitalis TaxID=229920 RepID=UPI0007803DC4|nr:TrmH family RNA methyltransferase [Leptolinea tardivitalis]GAP21021.1 rRNA methylase [Leptolinea tardivitalis]
MATAKTHPDNDPFSGESSPREACWYYECTSGTCRLRFPAPFKENLTCPLCHSPVLQKGRWESSNSVEAYKNDGSRLSVILDNLRSAYNVGSILRSSDGAGVQHAYLCGITPTPLHPRLSKTALSAEIHTSWSQHLNCVELVRDLRNRGELVVGLETSPSAINLLDSIEPWEGSLNLIVGNEVYGIDPAVMELCDRLYYLPMVGIKKSLNVSVSFGIAAYFLNQHHFQKLPVQSDTSF